MKKDKKENKQKDAVKLTHVAEIELPKNTHILFSLQDWTAKHKIVIVTVVLLLVSVIAGKTYYEYQQTANNKKNLSATEVGSLTAQVGKLILLPEGETPTIATVVDTGKLVGQPFFEHAQDGDKVLLFQKANKAILYSPAKNKIIEVGPIHQAPVPRVAGAETSASQAAQMSPAPTVKPVSIAIYNGSGITGAAKITEKQLLKHIANVVVTSKSNALGSYSQTYVVDLSNNPVVASAIANIVSGTVIDQVPNVETKPDSDILVILGK